MSPTPSDLVLVDTNLWIDFLSLPDFPERLDLEELMEGRRAATTGIVSAEVLYGARSEQDFERLAALLSRVHVLETTTAAWKTVAKLAFNLKQGGDSLPLPDLVIAAVSLHHGCSLFTRDQGFRRIPELRLYETTS